MGAPRLKVKYREEIVSALKDKFQFKSGMQVPKIEKICINRGVGQATADKKMVDVGVDEITKISGQQAIPTIAKKSVSNFKLREGMPIGAKVTLRGDRMYEFLDRLINVAVPRIRDFRGLPPNAFDGRGNHSLGIKEHNIFVELEFSDISRNRGMNITTVTTAKTDAEAKELLSLFGMPFRK